MHTPSAIIPIGRTIPKVTTKILKPVSLIRWAPAIDREATRLFSRISSGRPDRPPPVGRRDLRGIQMFGYRSQTGRAYCAPTPFLLGKLGNAVEGGEACCTPYQARALLALSHR
jgi:hypothetical protein